MYKGRFYFWLAMGISWGSVLAAIHVHPAFWGLFGLILVALIAREIPGWKSHHQ